MVRGARALAVVAVLVIAGCGGSSGGKTVVTGEATPAVIAEDALSGAAFEEEDVRRDTIGGNRSITIQGDVELSANYRLNATTSIAEYRAPASPPAVVSVYSVPMIRPFDAADVTVNPVRDLSTAELVGRVQTAYTSVSDVDHLRNGTATMLGNETTVATYSATGRAMDRQVSIAIHVASVVHRGDTVFVVGVHPEGMDARGAVVELMGAVEH